MNIIVRDVVMSITKRKVSCNDKLPLVLAIDIAIKLEKNFSIAITHKMINLILVDDIDGLVDYILYTT